MIPLAIGRGSSSPLGASIGPEGVNFSVFSRSATLVELLLFDREDAARPSRIIPLDPELHRTYHYWHALVPGLEAGQHYGFRASGSFEPERGLRFDPGKLLLDPYGLAVAVPEAYRRGAAGEAGTGMGPAMKSVVVDPERYDWEGDVPLQRPYSETVIYELHVRGFTRHPSSGVAQAKAGTYAGLIEKIPYLQDLGVTAVELLPVFQFDAQDAPRVAPITGGTRRSRSSRRTEPTARDATRLARWTSFATWSRPSIARASRSSSTSSSTTPRRGSPRPDLLLPRPRE